MRDPAAGGFFDVIRRRPGRNTGGDMRLSDTVRAGIKADTRHRLRFAQECLKGQSPYDAIDQMADEMTFSELVNEMFGDIAAQ